MPRSSPTGPGCCSWSARRSRCGRSRACRRRRSPPAGGIAIVNRGRHRLRRARVGDRRRRRRRGARTGRGDARRAGSREPSAAVARLRDRHRHAPARPRRRAARRPSARPLAAQPDPLLGELPALRRPARRRRRRPLGGALRRGVRRRARVSGTARSPGTGRTAPRAPRRGSSSRAGTTWTRASASSPRRRPTAASAREPRGRRPRARPGMATDEDLWAAVLELQVRGRDAGHGEAGYRAFARARLDDRRALFAAGRGAWYVAIDPATGAVTASCGIVVTEGRGRFQAVDTALELPAPRDLLAARRRGRAARGRGARRRALRDRRRRRLPRARAVRVARVRAGRASVRGVCSWPRSG